MIIFFSETLNVLLIIKILKMAQQINCSLQQSQKQTEATDKWLQHSTKQPPQNINQLYKQDTVSSQHPIVYETSKTLNQSIEGNQVSEIRKFMKKAEKLNETSFKRLHLDKSIMPQGSVLNLYKSNKNIVDEISTSAQRSKQIKQIYLKAKQISNNRTFHSYKSAKVNSFRHKRKLTTDSKWVQTQRYTQNQQQKQVERRKILGGTAQFNSFRKSLNSIKEDEDEQFMPVKRKRYQKQFNTISIAGERKTKLDVQTYLTNVSKVQHSFNSSVKKMNKQKVFQSNTIYHDEEKISSANSFLKPVAVNSSDNPWSDERSDTKQRQISFKRTSSPDSSRKRRPRLVQLSQQQPKIPKISLNSIQKQQQRETTQNSLCVQNNNSIKKSHPSSSTLFFPKQNTPNTQTFPRSDQNSFNLKPTISSFTQAPQYRQISIGTDTNNFIKPARAIHPININFNQSNSTWITSHFKPKSQFMKNIDTSNFKIKKYRNGVYFGQINEEGLKNGKGVVFYFNGRSYEGCFINDVKQGKGYECMPDGATYTGDFNNGLKEGKGIFEWANGQVYDGQWVAGKKNGSGMWKSPNGDSYLGEWKNGRIQGFGVLTVKEGDRYEGQFKNCMKNGLGTQRYSNRDTYVGQFYKNRPNGQGEYYYRNGDIYKGAFSNGLKHGQGSIKTAQGQLFQGELRNDKKCGYGQLKLPNGICYDGNFENDLKHGYGEQTDAQGIITKGYWINGQLVQNQMGPIIEDELDRQESIVVKNKKTKRTNKSIQLSTSKQKKQKKRQISRSPIQNSKSKQKSKCKIRHNSIEEDPNFHRACGCKRKH